MWEKSRIRFKSPTLNHTGAVRQTCGFRRRRGRGMSFSPAIAMPYAIRESRMARHVGMRFSPAHAMPSSTTTKRGAEL